MRIFGLIGFPLSHSFSKKYFDEKFERLAITDIEYRNFEIDSISKLEPLMQAHPDLCGLNVTIPYKQAVIPHLSRLSAEAEAVGAVNCIHITPGGTTGYNTDVFGFEMSIKPFIENHYERALILGTGGASLAVAYVLKKWGIQYFHVTRNATASNMVNYKDLSAESLKHYPLIINTTPLGMFPDTESKPMLPYEGITQNHFCYDLVYNPQETAFMREASMRGAKVMNGLKMLELQAERSWQMWNTEL